MRRRGERGVKGRGVGGERHTQRGEGGTDRGERG